MNRTLNLEQLKEIARKAAKNGGFQRNDVKLSSKMDIVDRTLIQARNLTKRLRDYSN